MHSFVLVTRFEAGKRVTIVRETTYPPYTALVYQFLSLLRMLGFTNNNSHHRFMNNFNTGVCITKLRRSQMLKKNSVTSYKKSEFFVWDKETQQLTNGIIIYSYYDQCLRCKFPFRKRLLPFYRHSDIFGPFSVQFY